ncbi:MNNG and nitrosoguanidine resistance protein [Xylariaceae sp. AK1471]|nr:MNNG and nitrosoguanidine resistance protein [Xylariaceae sp. AK1471]
MREVVHKQAQGRLPDASNLLIAGRGNGSEKSGTSRTKPSQYNQANQPNRQTPRQSYQSSYSQRSQDGASNQNSFNPHDYDSTNEHNVRDYGQVLWETQYKQPHHSVGFWHPKMSKVRAHVLMLWARTIIILMAFIFAALSLYWAVIYNVRSNLRALEVHVVDFDGQMPPYDNVTPVVGPAMTDLIQQIQAMPLQPSLGYRIVPPAHYNYSPIAVRQGVYNWDAWASIIINPNATALLLEAVTIGNASYDPTGAIQYIIQTARQETNTYNYILPELQKLTSQFTSQFGASWSKMLFTNTSFSPLALAQAPAAVNPAVVPLQIDLRPFAPSTATPAVSIGLIYLIIVAFFSFTFFLPIHNVRFLSFVTDAYPIPISFSLPSIHEGSIDMGEYRCRCLLTCSGKQKYVQPQGHPPLHFWHLIVWRWLATVVSYFLVSLTYSLVSLAFGVPFWRPPGSATEVTLNATAYGRGSFVVYWMLNFVGMIALGIACENVAMILGQPWTALWLIFWVITNVATSFYALELAPAFFRWGRAWPLHHIVQASRQIIFDLKSEIGLNFGVLFAWAAVNTALFPLCCYFMRWRTEHEQRKAEMVKDRYVVYTDEGDQEIPKREGDKQPKMRRGFMRGI